MVFLPSIRHASPLPEPQVTRVARSLTLKSAGVPVGALVNQPAAGGEPRGSRDTPQLAQRIPQVPNSQAHLAAFGALGLAAVSGSDGSRRHRRTAGLAIAAAPPNAATETTGDFGEVRAPSIFDRTPAPRSAPRMAAAALAPAS